MALPNLPYSALRIISEPNVPAKPALDIPGPSKSPAIPVIPSMLSAASLAFSMVFFILLFIAVLNASSGFTFLKILSDKLLKAFCFSTIPATSAFLNLTASGSEVFFIRLSNCVVKDWNCSLWNFNISSIPVAVLHCSSKDLL